MCRSYLSLRQWKAEPFEKTPKSLQLLRCVWTKLTVTCVIDVTVIDGQIVREIT